jgi:hypothetical protein
MKIHEIVAPGFNPRPWLAGKCFDFALALHERMPDAEFVVIRSWIGKQLVANHVALRRGDVYYDARGAIPDARSFLAYHTDVWDGASAELIEPISREDVERHAGVAGVPPPYKGNRYIAAARQAVAAVYG